MSAVVTGTFGPKMDASLLLDTLHTFSPQYRDQQQRSSRRTMTNHVTDLEVKNYSKVVQVVPEQSVAVEYLYATITSIKRRLTLQRWWTPSKHA